MVYRTDAVDFVDGLDPGWADLVVNSPSSGLFNEPGNSVLWPAMMMRALKDDGLLAIVHMIKFPDRWIPAATAVGWHLLSKSESPELPAPSAKSIVLMTKTAETAFDPFPDPFWIDDCDRVPWGSSFPVKVITHLIERYTEPGDLVFDPFMGLGTTAVAAERTGRRWVGCEIEHSRWEKCLKRIERDTDWRRDAV